jgi:hypothetical protein
MVFRGFNFPALLVAALSLEIIENVFPHVSKVADVAERERVQHLEVGVAAQSELDSPVAMLKKLECGEREIVMLRPQFGRGQSDIDVRSI